MAPDTLRDFLTVSPDENGVKRRQAEFIILHQLNNRGPASKKELENRVKQTARKIGERDSEPPILFDSTTSQAEHRSREFNEVLERCIHRDWIESLVDGKYGITDQGIERVDNLQSDAEYQISRITDLL